MGALMLMAELDERFGLELTAEVSRRMRRIGDVLDFLHRQGVLQEDG
jgi:acyl carrier protein